MGAGTITRKFAALFLVVGAVTSLLVLTGSSRAVFAEEYVSSRNCPCKGTTVREVLKSGVPQRSDYESLFRGELYRQMERFSNEFQNKHSTVLEIYGRKWVQDPLHTWSRVYEYPYVFSRVLRAASANSKEKLSVLDLGSGVTFLPWFIYESLHTRISLMSAMDLDPDYASLYDNINAMEKYQVSFHLQDISTLVDASDEAYDIIYSVSVFEHMEDAFATIGNIERVLKRGGTFIVSFDLVHDNSTNSMRLTEAEKVLQALKDTFVEVDPNPADTRKEFNADPVVPETMQTYYPNYDSSGLGTQKLAFSCHEFLKV